LIAFQSTRNGRADIYVAKADGTEQRQLTTNPVADSGPVWSPDGTKIAFTRSDDSIPTQKLSDVYVVDVASGVETAISTSDAIDENPAWSPDSTRLVYESESDGNRDLIVANADGSGSHPLVDAGGQKTDADWSPDGTKVLFSMAVHEKPDIYVVNADGTGLQRLTDHPGTDKTPRWSPDGTLIAFVTDRANITPTPKRTDPGETPGPRPTVPTLVPQFDVYVMNADGSAPARVSPDDWEDSDPVWKPASR
jgi:TolB protein